MFSFIKIFHLIHFFFFFLSLVDFVAMRSEQKVSSLDLNFIAIFVFLVTFPTSKGNDHGSYKECSSLGSCGKIKNIGYPFWGISPRSKHCGHPEFELYCNGDNLIWFIRNLQIQRIDKFSMTIRLIDPHTNGIDDHCFLNSSIEDNFLEYSQRIENISLFHNCSNPDKERFQNVKCSDDVYYWENESKEELNKYCDRQIQIPVLGKDELEQGRKSLEKVLKMGIEANYSKMYHEYCSSCEKSGGACGSSIDSKFKCFRKSDRLLRHTLEIAIPVCSLFILTALISSIFYYKKHKVTSRTISYDHKRSDLEIGNLFFGIPVFSYAELREATDNFNPDCELGDGGFGVVYHGKLKDGREVAVKRLHERSYKQLEQLRNEVEILTKLSHPNLVKLYGCTSRYSREFLLAYEYIPNGTVADHLHGNRSQSKSLTWTIRSKIAVQTASTLSYLHASDIIHCDVKTNNILLDSNFTVKVADFGLSRLFPLDVTHVSTCPQGTPGYLDPDYYKCYRVSKKSDVYSFGVVLIELISSLPAVDVNRDEDNINLSTYAMNKLRHGKLCELVDPELGFESDCKVKRMVTLVAELAFQCLQQEKEVRPSMEEVVEELKQIGSMDEDEVEQPVGGDVQDPRCSPKSVISGLASRSTVPNVSG